MLNINIGLFLLFSLLISFFIAPISIYGQETPNAAPTTDTAANDTAANDTAANDTAANDTAANDTAANDTAVIDMGMPEVFVFDEADPDNLNQVFHSDDTGEFNNILVRINTTQAIDVFNCLLVGVNNNFNENKVCKISPTSAQTTFVDLDNGGYVLTISATDNDNEVVGKSAEFRFYVIGDESAANNTNLVYESIFSSSLPIVFLAVIAIAMVIPLLFDMFFAYRNKSKESIDKESRAPVGMQGLYRTLMTFGVILLVGTVIFYVLALITLNMNNPTSNTTLQSLIDVLKNLSAILGTALATIIAFYFGLRGAESAAEKGAAAASSVQTETIPPTIVGIYPADGQKGVSVNSNVAASFSKQMNSSTINTSTFTLKKNGEADIIEGELTLFPDGKDVMLNPSSNLDSGTKYTATITKDVKDVAGNAMTTDKTWSFETAVQEEQPEQPE